MSRYDDDYDVMGGAENEKTPFCYLSGSNMLQDASNKRHELC